MTFEQAADAARDHARHYSLYHKQSDDGEMALADKVMLAQHITALAVHGGNYCAEGPAWWAKNTGDELIAAHIDLHERMAQ